MDRKRNLKQKLDSFAGKFEFFRGLGKRKAKKEKRRKLQTPSKRGRKWKRRQKGAMPSRVKQAWTEVVEVPLQTSHEVIRERPPAVDDEAEAEREDFDGTKYEWFEQVSALKQKQVRKDHFEKRKRCMCVHRTVVLNSSSFPF